MDSFKLILPTVFLFMLGKHIYTLPSIYKKALYPKTVSKVLSKTDASTTEFIIILPFNYLASKEQGTLIL